MVEGKGVEKWEDNYSYMFKGGRERKLNIIPFSN